MPFVRKAVTPEVLEALGLSSLTANQKLGQINRQLIFDLDTRSSLIVHPYSYIDYPDRHLFFRVDGNGFPTWEYLRPADGHDRVEIFFNRDANPGYRARVVPCTVKRLQSLGTSRLDLFR